MLPRSSRVLVTASLCALLGACGSGMPSVKTQPDRREYVTPKIDENLAKTMKCPAATLTFVRTEDKGGTYYDLYVAEGCGQRTEFMTLVTVSGDDKSWAAMSAAGPVPTEQDYREQARAQLVKTARFDLECDDAEFTELNEVITPMRNVYEASIGAMGCNKKSTYLTRCSQTGYQAGKHELACTSTITSAPTKP